jgi:hypothetical protein
MEHDTALIFKAAARVGLRSWQLDRGIVNVIKYTLDKYRYWDDIDAEIKTQLMIK